MKLRIASVKLRTPYKVPGGTARPIKVQQEEVAALLDSELFSEAPGFTDLVQHDICLKKDAPARQKSYRIPERLVPELKKEINFMLELGIIEFDPYPMPRIDDLLERVGGAREVTYLGYIIGFGKIRPQVGKVDAVHTFPVPTTKKKEVDGEMKLVVFLSRRLLDRETRYSTVEKECLAMKWAIESLRYYLLGRHFFLEKDHRALQWLHRKKNANARIAGWSESPSLPNNICVAEQHLQSLRRRFEKHAQYKEEYTACVNNMLQQGHAEAVPSEEQEKDDGQLWYIPHHGVHHPTKEDAVHMVKSLTDLCSKGGFKLSKWVSNSRTVLMSVPEERRAKEIKNLDLDKDQLPVERVLGLQWSIETDEFRFRTSVQGHPQTRRGILSVVSSLYNPLGILALFSMPAKLLLQELCQQNLKWDEVIPHSLSRKWLDWLEDLQLISSFKVERCVKPSCNRKPDKAQLHHFSDASQDGYGTVSYVKLEKNNISHVAFILGKARVAPMKQTTIPRLELTAAVLAVRVNKLLQKELQIQLEKPVFWTDGTTVLKYISSETRRFHTFVANRISVIQEATDVNQWRYVSSKENPADDASRGMRDEEFLRCRRWINGPEFLHRSEEEWPKLDVDHHAIPADDPEVKKDLTT
ncbi:uncharacterized protein LOC107837133 [Poecilia formosa]|uniref:uncharacterized protein LOC107837133 n=1 Tax=Poecilia formosa TaxID=48698 RepID=UPI0007B8155A|nr:PREDICTED: uncharacterized protein LOC107837133 [Poecilia formosa]